MSIRPDYSTENRSYHGPVPANTQSRFASVEGKFTVGTLLQTDVLDVVRKEPVGPPALRTGYEVSLSNVLKEIYTSVGMIRCQGEQLGSCTLISWNLGVIPCHCIEELDVTQMTGTFGYLSDNENLQTRVGRSFNIESIVEYDLELDYAIVRFGGSPGKDYGFVPLNSHATAQNDPALLHHPIGKPLKVSVRPIVHSKWYSYKLTTYHDSDYGSSGGAYICPSGVLVAIHLGATRNPREGYNLKRLALPILRIIEAHPNGILARLAYQTLDQEDLNHSIGDPTNFLPYVSRDYIDLENYDREMMRKEGYFVRMADDETPGIIIDSHQKKHLPGWPTQYGGDSGSRFPQTINNDDLVAIAQAIANDVQLFNDFSTHATGIKVIRWDLNKALLGNPLYKKLTNPPGRNGKNGSPVTRIGIEYGWMNHRNSWEMHFYPI